MINTDDFIKRLEILLDFYSLSASVFADKMGVQRSGLSHLMSGRNKPSLDFVMKIVENFPEVDLYWLLNGEGAFPKNETLPHAVAESTNSPAPEKNDGIPLDLFSTDDAPIIKEKEQHIPQDLFSSVKNKPDTIITNKLKEIDRIVIFYTDGTFKNYNPEN